MGEYKDFAVGDGTETITATFKQPEPSGWKCYMFGTTIGGSGIVWQPNKGGVPNWFWRKMQYLCFGNRWVKGGK